MQTNVSIITRGLNASLALFLRLIYIITMFAYSPLYGEKKLMMQTARISSQVENIVNQAYSLSVSIAIHCCLYSLLARQHAVVCYMKSISQT